MAAFPVLGARRIQNRVRVETRPLVGDRDFGRARAQRRSHPHELPRILLVSIQDGIGKSLAHRDSQVQRRSRAREGQSLAGLDHFGHYLTDESDSRGELELYAPGQPSRTPGARSTLSLQVLPPLQPQFVAEDREEDILHAPCGQSLDQALDGLVGHDGHEIGSWTVGKPHLANRLAGIGQVDEGDPRGVTRPLLPHRCYLAGNAERLEFLDQAVGHLSTVGADEGVCR